MNTKETWIEETLASLDKVKAIDMPSSLSLRIVQELNEGKVKVISIRPQIRWAVAASLVLLIGLNSLIIIQYNKSIKQNKQEAYNLYKNYFDYTEQF